MTQWEALEQGADEPLTDYVKRLEAERDKPGLTTAMKSAELNRMLRDAKKRRRDMNAQLKKPPNIREWEAARRESPALQEVKRLFILLAPGEREQFFLWWSASGAKDAEAAAVKKGRQGKLTAADFEKIPVVEAERVRALPKKGE